MAEAALQTDRVREVEARSEVFRRELGLVDLVLIQVMYIVGSGWVGAAAKLGPSHVVFWTLAALTFYLPQAAVVIFLNRLMPLEGGLYQWATVGFGRPLGFLVGWNLWAYSVLMVATFAVMVATNLSYLLDPSSAWLTRTVWYTPLASLAFIAVVSAVSVRGLGVGKWLQNAGGLAQFIVYGSLVGIPLVAIWRGSLEHYQPLAVAAPELSLLNVNIFTKLALGAFSGFEYVAIMAGECRDAKRSIGRAVAIATPICVLLFVFGTSSVLALVPRDQIDLVSPVPQALVAGAGTAGWTALIAPMVILLLLVRQLGNTTYVLGGASRLPLVAGWDGLLPAWFTRLHPHFRTPVNSILFVALLTVGLALAAQTGVGLQEAFQLLDNAGGLLYAFVYLSLFAIPLFGSMRLSERPPLWLRLAAAVGLGVSLLYAAFTIFPIVEVQSWQLFAAKILAVVVGANLLGIAIYAAAGRGLAAEDTKKNRHGDAENTEKT
jgi:glutamate:GABA antiporter